MTPADRAALREAAQRATPGPWTVTPPAETAGWGRCVSATRPGVIVARVTGRGNQQVANAAYIAAAHPSAVLALLDALDTAERGERVLGAFDEADRLERERDAALARVAVLERERDVALDAAFEEHRRNVDRFLASGAGYAITDEVCPHGKAIGRFETCRICYFKAQQAERANPSPMRRRAFTVFARLAGRVAELEAALRAERAWLASAPCDEGCDSECENRRAMERIDRALAGAGEDAT